MERREGYAPDGDIMDETARKIPFPVKIALAAAVTAVVGLQIGVVLQTMRSRGRPKGAPRRLYSRREEYYAPSSATKGAINVAIKLAPIIIPYVVKIFAKAAVVGVDLQDSEAMTEFAAKHMGDDTQIGKMARKAGISPMALRKQILKKVKELASDEEFVEKVEEGASGAATKYAKKKGVIKDDE